MADAPVAAPKGEVKLPGLGKVSKKTLMIGGLVGGGVLAYAYYRHSKGASSASSTTAAGTAAADIDPQTSYPTGSPEDLAALQAQQGGGLDTSTGSIDPLTGLPEGSLQDQQALQDYGTGGGTGTTTSTSTGTTTATTNSEWEQQAIADMEAGGVSQHTVTDAEAGLPRYLAKLALTDAQATAVQMAVGLAGPPPVGGPYSIKRKPPAKKPPHPVTKTIIADGRSTLYDIARDNGTNEAHVVSLNLNLAHYVGSKKHIPKGTKVKV